jgi:hypothetical protein
MRHSSSIDDSELQPAAALGVQAAQVGRDVTSSVKQKWRSPQQQQQQHGLVLGHFAGLATVKEGKSLRLIQLPADAEAAARKAQAASTAVAAVAVGGEVEELGTATTLPA